MDKETNYPVSGFSFDFHLCCFLEYNQRRLMKDWRNETEMNVVLNSEAVHQHYAAEKIHEDVFAPLKLFFSEGVMYYVAA